MSRSVLADFVGTMTVETVDWESRTKGRVILGEGQLVFAKSDDDSVSIPLSSVFDVNLDNTPDKFGPFPARPVTIGFREDGSRRAAVVAAGEDTIEKFAVVLYKALLNGTTVRIQHPARVGGRTTDEAYRYGELAVSQGIVTVDCADESVYIDLGAITDFDRVRREVDGKPERVLEIAHMQDGTALMTHLTTLDGRTLSILGRYLRRKYDALMASLDAISFTEPKIQVLVTLYSTGDVDVDLTSVLDASSAQITSLLEQLSQDGLVKHDGAAPALTAKGQVVANHYLERVNA